ncbi:DUF2478 domain-containing protein [Parasedimentitalea psychrophila]|uniref:DUF2478 domain-containing protein n=1 Tax=Parasedimentitalea psychrophila TaxID=2997337 RepID=A0A9Y2P2Z7_9RHOB|nr:DUF2478 domain-containing protein [Parasedimentitalea psychrophila]WIY25562.1 DUF2478 domain-containing protein [Parasedimentitalea psychrophila]
MQIAYVTSQTRGETDRLLSEIAAQLQAQGKSLAGIVKVSNYQSSFENGCDMKVRVLPEGPEIKITQNLGAGSDACRLDPSAITEAVTRVETGSMDGPDLFMLNKFGPEEAAGRGFCNVIGSALEAGVPVLVGVGGASIEAFESFAGGLAVPLADNEQAILDWVLSAISGHQTRSPAATG